MRVGDVPPVPSPPHTRLGESAESPSPPQNARPGNPKDFRRRDKIDFKSRPAHQLKTSSGLSLFRAGLAHAKCSREQLKDQTDAPFTRNSLWATKSCDRPWDLALDTFVSHANLTNDRSRSILYSAANSAQWYRLRSFVELFNVVFRISVQPRSPSSGLPTHF
jgi:hypothetical protein